MCIPATGWSSIQWQQVAPANGQSTSEPATAAVGTSSCKLFKSRLHSHQLPMILLTIGTLAQACTVSSFMLIRWRFNLVQPEINPRQTRILSHRQQSASTTHKNSVPTGQKTMVSPLQIPEGSCHKNLAIKFLSHFKKSHRKDQLTCAAYCNRNNTRSVPDKSTVSAGGTAPLYLKGTVTAQFVTLLCSSPVCTSHCANLHTVCSHLFLELVLFFSNMLITQRSLLPPLSLLLSLSLLKKLAALHLHSERAVRTFFCSLHTLPTLSTLYLRCFQTLIIQLVKKNQHCLPYFMFRCVF